MLQIQPFACNKYPNPGTIPCRKHSRSGFIYYNCGNTSLDKATDNLEICEASSYSKNCEKKAGLAALKGLAVYKLFHHPFQAGVTVIPLF